VPLDHAFGELLADLAPVAAGAVLVSHLEEILELVLGGLPLTADAEVEAVHCESPHDGPVIQG
jgi:hypothetical protein